MIAGLVMAGMVQVKFTGLRKRENCIQWYLYCSSLYYIINLELALPHDYVPATCLSGLSNIWNLITLVLNNIIFKTHADWRIGRNQCLQEGVWDTMFAKIWIAIRKEKISSQPSALVRAVVGVWSACLRNVNSSSMGLWEFSFKISKFWICLLSKLVTFI